jgi:hypothetical protein
MGECVIAYNYLLPNLAAVGVRIAAGGGCGWRLAKRG